MPSQAMKVFLSAFTVRNLVVCSLLWILSLGCSCLTTWRAQRGASVPRVGEPMPAGASIITIEQKDRTLCSQWIDASGVRYYFNVKCGGSTVVSVATLDPHFRSPEGLAIGDPFGSALSIKGSKLDIFDGSCGIALPSGWIARPTDVTNRGRKFCLSQLSEPIDCFETHTPLIGRVDSY